MSRRRAKGVPAAGDRAASETPENGVRARWASLPPGVRHGLAYLLFALATLACLAIPSYPYVFPEGKEARLIGPDAYYHLRHAKTAYAHYPVVARHDFMIGFPQGEVGLNQGFFDVGLATVMKLGGGLLTPQEVLALVSPFCQLVAAAAGFLWFLRRGNQRCAYLFLLFCVLYPGPMKAIAALGHGDHHAFEVMMVMLIAMSLDFFLRPTSSWKWGPLAVLPLFLMYLSWPGSALHLLLVGAVFYIRAWQPPVEGERLALKGALYAITLLLLIEVSAALWPWSVIWPTSRQLFELGGVALLVGYPVLVWLSGRPVKRRALLAAGLVLALLLLISLTETGRSALLSLFETRTRQVAEHTPASIPLLFRWFGFLWLVAAAVPIRVWQRKAWWEAVTPVIFGAGLVFFWFRTYDFNYYTPIALAAGAAYVLGSLEWKKPVMGVVVFLAVLPLIPALMEHPWGDRRTMRDIVLYTDGLESASKYLQRVQGPPLPAEERKYGLICPWDLGNILSETADTPVGYAETTSKGLAQMMFTDKPEEVYQKMVAPAKPFRYVLIPARNVAEKFLGEMGAADLQVGEMFGRGDKVKWQDREVTLLAPTERNRASFINRLYWDMGDYMGHFRLVYETPQQSLHVQRIRPDLKIEFYAWPATPENLLTNLKPLLDTPEKIQDTTRGAVVGARQASEVRIFEAVPGALLEGTTKPGAVVEASLPLVAPNTRRRWTGVWSTKADPTGHFSLRVPYSTTDALNSDPDTVKARGPYDVTANGKRSQQPVSEEEVQQERKLIVQ